MPRLFTFAALLCLILTGAGQAQSLRVTDDGSHAGYVTLAWDEAENTTYRLERQVSGNWETVYEGPATATTLSGLSDGNYTFRLFVDDQPAGEMLGFEVRHHPLQRALGFFAMGAVLFVILLIILAPALRPAEVQHD